MELEDLKSAWKAVPEEKTYDKNKIFEMLKAKSSSTIKWLFLFTLAEFLSVITFTSFSLIKGKLINGLDINNNGIFSNYIIGSIVTLIFTFLFLGFSYINYKKISLNNTIVDLMKQIVRFRKTVNYFILFIVISLIAVSIPYYYNLGKNLYAQKAGSDININEASTVGYIAVVVAISFILIITTVYYGLIYFVFLRKLSNNLKELNEINK